MYYYYFKHTYLQRVRAQVTWAPRQVSLIYSMHTRVHYIHATCMCVCVCLPKDVKRYFIYIYMYTYTGTCYTCNEQRLSLLRNLDWIVKKKATQHPLFSCMENVHTWYLYRYYRTCKYRVRYVIQNNIQVISLSIQNQIRYLVIY